MKLKKCKKCGGDEFYIQEIIFHEAALCPTGRDLTVYGHPASGIERIFCKKCETNYSENDFKKINFY
jgi:predicted nucleic-acid-binding Zn-ribbon protein